MCRLKLVTSGRVWRSRSLRFRPKGLEGESEAWSGYGVYGVRGVSKNFPGLLLLFAACFEDEVKEPEAAGVWGKEYRRRFRGEDRRSDELVSTDTWSVMLRFLIILDSHGGVVKKHRQNFRDKIKYTNKSHVVATTRLIDARASS